MQWAGSDTAALCPLHVFVLANVLRCPIVIYGESEAKVGSLEQAVPTTAGLRTTLCLKHCCQASDMPGVYLPLLWEKVARHLCTSNLSCLLQAISETCKAPLCISYDAGHFWALVQRSPRSGASMVPLSRPDGSVLTVKFVEDHEVEALLVLILLTQYGRTQYSCCAPT